MPVITHNKYHRRILKWLHECGPEHTRQLLLKVAGVTPSGHQFAQRTYRARRALKQLLSYGLAREQDKNKKKIMLTFEGWVYYVATVLKEPANECALVAARHSEASTKEEAQVVLDEPGCSGKVGSRDL